MAKYEIKDGACIIPIGTTEIERWGYSYLDFRSIVIPDTVTKIGAGAFKNCIALSSIVIPESVEEIESEYNESLVMIERHIYGDIKNWNPYAKREEGHPFAGCVGLESIVVANGNKKYDSRNNCNAIIEKATNKLIVGCKNTIVPNSVTEIVSKAFKDCIGLTSMIVPNSVTKIGKGAFMGCKDLTSIVIPDSVTEIGERAFDGCIGLTNVTLPNSVTKIGSYAFQGCSGLTSIVIPDSVTEIEYSAFDDCIGLTNVTIPNSVTDIGCHAFYGCI